MTQSGFAPDTAPVHVYRCSFPELFPRQRRICLTVEGAVVDMAAHQQIAWLTHGISINRGGAAQDVIDINPDLALIENCSDLVILAVENIFFRPKRTASRPAAITSPDVIV